MIELYSKYRPLKLSDVVGQTHVVKTLAASAKQNRFSHAYLFSGNKGCGKTSTARILATLLNSSKEQCENCYDIEVLKSIQNGSSPDVLEFDGAKNRTVEEIDKFIQSAYFAPAVLNKKVLIIDECHQLSSKAISSLLKIVEEPPSYLTFIFCTTEFNKIPDTIVSRSQCYSFRKIGKKEIAQRLLAISTLENIKITESGAETIAYFADGSMRDAIGLLQQISTLAQGKEINDGNVSTYFGKVGLKGCMQLASYIFDKDVINCINCVNDLYVSNVNINSLMYELTEIMRKAMIIKSCNGDFEELNVDKEDLSEIIEISKNVDLKKMFNIYKNFSQIKKDLEYNINERWVMESAILNCIYME